MHDLLRDLAKVWGDYSAVLEQQRRILIIDDDLDAARLFVEVLDESHFECEHVTRGETALEKFEEGRYQAVVCDKNLPGIDGLQTIERIHLFDSDCEAILVTAYANVDSVLACIDLRAADYLVKPLLDINLLSAAVERACRRRRRRLLSRRMVADLRDAIHQRASDADLSRLNEARDRIDAYRSRLKQKRIVLMAATLVRELKKIIERLDDNGFGIVESTDPEAALERCSEGRINVVVVGDAFESMDGLEFCDKLMDLAARPELVLVGSPGTHEMALQALRRGASAFVGKPILDAEEFVLAVERACREQHERLYHARLVKELHEILNSMAGREARPTPEESINEVIGEFDVETARLAVALFGLRESVDE